MKNVLKYSIAAALLATSGTAIAGSNDGRWQVKALGSFVLPDGKITEVQLDGVGLPAGTQTEADDNFVPTVAIEYFVTPNISLETICCVTQHDVTGTGPLAGAGLVSNANIIPATLTAKYHIETGSGLETTNCPRWMVRWSSRVSALGSTPNSSCITSRQRLNWARAAYRWPSRQLTRMAVR